MEKVSKQHAGGHILDAGGHDKINATAALLLYSAVYGTA
jgi:hypothetical protein